MICHETCYKEMILIHSLFLETFRNAAPFMVSDLDWVMSMDFARSLIYLVYHVQWALTSVCFNVILQMLLGYILWTCSLIIIPCRAMWRNKLYVFTWPEFITINQNSSKQYHFNCFWNSCRLVNIRYVNLHFHHLHILHSSEVQNRLVMRYGVGNSSSVNL